MLNVKISQEDSSYQLLTCERKKRKRKEREQCVIVRSAKSDFLGRSLFFFLFYSNKKEKENEEESNNVIKFLFVTIEYRTYA